MPHPFPRRSPQTQMRATRTMRIGVLFLCLAALGFVACSGAAVSDLTEIQQTVRERFPKVRQMQVEELVELLESTEPGEKPLLIDVRAKDEYAVSHLPGAVQAEGEAVLEAVKSARVAGDRPVILYCSVGYRSSQAAQVLMDAGVTDVANLEGSIFAWANAGHTVVRGTDAVREVHPYDKKWGQMLDKELWAFKPGD